MRLKAQSQMPFDQPGAIDPVFRFKCPVSLFIGELIEQTSWRSWRLPGFIFRKISNEEVCAMSDWAYDLDVYDEGITTEEASVCRWESDRDELMPEDWEQIMGGPDDSEFERMDDRFEAAYEASRQDETLEMLKEQTAELDSPEADGGVQYRAKARPVPFFNEEDIPF